MRFLTDKLFAVVTLVCVLLGAERAGAQLASLEVGKVYHFTNARFTGYALGVNADAQVRGVTPVNKADHNQLWVVAEKDESGNFRLQSLGHGGILQAKGQNGEWVLVDRSVTDDTYLVLDKTGNYNVFRGVNYNGGYGFANVASGHNYKILGWTHVNDLGSQWTIENISLDESALNKALDKHAYSNNAIREAVSTALTNLFVDAACTTPKKSVTTAELESDEDYQTLTPTLRNMVKKVYGKAWAEKNYDNNKEAWDADYAKKYRVQWYEPYTEPECAAAALRINAHSNLNNPTGIFANNGDVLFVMVEGEIKDGAHLYLSSYTGHNKLGGYDEGIALHTGLNVIPVTADGTNYCINYVVKTFDASQGTGKKAIVQGRELSAYPDLQIHIEGGHINGYWNKMGDDAAHNGDFNYPADTDSDWDYIKARATQTDVTVLGEYITLQFPLTDAGTGDDKGMGTFFNSYNGKTTSLVSTIEEWDNVMIWERLLMGVVGKSTIEQEDKVSPYSDKSSVVSYTGDDADEFGCDYSEYYRIHGLSFGTEGGYMYGGWDHCGYNFNTMESIMINLPNEAGPHWGPAHEIGHQHQGPLNMRGLTEVTNNLFANVVLWYYGKSTSRYNGTDAALSNVLAQFNADGTDFFSNNIWAQTVMYYKLFLYYHVLGHNTKFYPRLFEMLRQNPMTIAYSQDGSQCLMHFYKMCCDAAGEDLTEFFRAHGFFRVMEERFVGDYSNAVYNLTQQQIETAIAEVKAKKYPENLSVLFINDATGENIQSHRDDVEYLANFNDGNTCAEMGCYATFETAATPTYNYTISGNTISMEGTGGVGFALLNDKGEIIGFSDKKNFALSTDAMLAISEGTAQIIALHSDGKPVKVESEMNENEIKRTLLLNLIEQAEEMASLIDNEGKKVGFYKGNYTTELQSALTKAQDVVANNTISAYAPIFNTLKTAIEDLKSKEFAKITMKPGTYTLRNFAYTTRYLSVNESEEVVTTTNAELADTEKWVFEQADGNNVYYIKNLSTGKYVNALAQSTVVSATTTDIANAKGWLVEDLGDGVFGLRCQDENSQAMHSAANEGYKIVGWSTDAMASRWYLTALETEQLTAEEQALEELIALSEDMLERMANVNVTADPVTLTADQYYCNAPMTANWYGDGFKGYHVLFDNNYSTYLHTDYTGADSEDGLDHYLRIDLGEGNSASLFTFNYATRDNSNQNPTAIMVEGSNAADGEYEFVANLTRDTDKLVSGENAEYNSAVLGSSDKSYRYLRFTVKETIQGATAGPEDNKHTFFVFSEFGVSKAAYTVTALQQYSMLTDADATATFHAIRQAKYDYVNATETADYIAAYNALKVYYDKLVAAYNTCNQTELDSKKTELQELIAKTSTLIASCGEVTYHSAGFDGEAPLQVTDANGKFYISTNAQSSQEGPISGLIDGIVGNPASATYFHTDYSGNNSSDGLDHYIQVNLGESVKAFNFTYTNRHNTDANYATAMTILGSTDGENFEEITTLANLPAQAAAVYTSEQINPTTGYTYLRFMVTANSSNNIKGGHPFFHMAEFDLMIQGESDSYTVQMNPNVGAVTEDILLVTYQENQEAQSASEYAMSATQLDKAIADLQAKYDALLAAYNDIAADVKEAMQAAQTFLDETPQTVGYPVISQREAFQRAIDAHESVEAIKEAKEAFIATTDILKPESGKAYVFTNVHPAGGQRYLNYTDGGLTFVARGEASVDDLPESAKWYCRQLETGQYVFVNTAGKYLVFKGSNNGCNENKGYVGTYDATYSPITVDKMVTGNYTGDATMEDLFGYIAFGGRRVSQDISAYFVSTSTGGFQQDMGWTMRYTNDYSTAFVVEEVSNYPLAVTKLTTTDAERDVLLSNIEYGKTIGTFSAPYPTVIPNGVIVYYATQDWDGEKIALTPIESGYALPANQGVIVLGDKGVDAISFLPATTETSADLRLNKFLHSATSPVEMGGSDYILAKAGQGIGFYQATEGTTLKVGKAYLRLPLSQASPSLVLSFDQILTGVDRCTQYGSPAAQSIFDLSGRRVTTIQRGGLYIVNGKKVIVKSSK